MYGEHIECRGSMCNNVEYSSDLITKELIRLFFFSFVET